MRAFRYALPALGAGVVASHAGHLGDYALGPRTGDDPAPVLEALIHGHLSHALGQQPVMGLSSILLRWPFAALATALGGGHELTYRLGVFACALVVGLVWIATADAAGARGRSWLGAGAISALALLNPFTLAAVWWGHPEELLGGALCVAAVLASLHDRPLVAGAALGLALGTKQWALLAVVPTLLACRSGRVRLVAVAAAVAAPLALAMPVADPVAFLRAARVIGSMHLVSTSSWWWLLSPTHNVTVTDGGALATTAIHTLPLGLHRSGVSWLAPACAIPLGWAYWRRRGTRDPAAALGLLALLMLLRSTLDPIWMLYYQVPFIIALVTWETLARRGLPVISLVAIVGLWATTGQLAAHPELEALAYLVVTFGIAAWLALLVFGPPRRYRVPVVSWSRRRVEGSVARAAAD